MKSALQEVTTKSVSRLAAISCAAAPVPAARRSEHRLALEPPQRPAGRAVGEQPVADGDAGARQRRAGFEAPRPSRAEHVDAVAMHGRDPDRLAGGELVRVEPGLEDVRPAEVAQAEGI